MDNQSSTPENKDNENGATSIDVVSRPSLSDISPSVTAPEMDKTSEAPVNPALSAPAGAVGGVPVTSGTGGKSKLVPVLLVILLVIVFVGGVYGVYEWQHKKVTNSEAQVTTLQTQVNTLNAKIAKEATVSINTNTTGSSTSSSTNSSGLTVYKLTGLGVEFSVPAILADLTNSTNSANTVSNLSTQTLTDLDVGCTASSTAGLALGNINKGTGQFTATAGVTLIKQFSTYYISYTPAPKACSTVTQVNSLTTTLTTDLKSNFASIQAIGS